MSWRKGNNAKSIYKYNHDKHKHRMGSCEWLPRDNDLCVCIEPAGDCFDNYLAIKIGNNGKYEVIGRFGAYSFGEPCGELTKRDFHLLQAGEPIDISIGANNG